MKSNFDQSIRNELINRIHSLDEHHQARWGKMNVYQMTLHCTLWDEWILGTHNPVYRQNFIGKVFGRRSLKSTLNSKMMKINMPAGREFIVKKETGNLAMQKERWSRRISEYEQYSNPAFIHDFFGKMTKEQIGILAYKHSDHHLRQFGA
jgi:hypothetical protein